MNENIRKATNLANALFAEYNLVGWSIGFEASIKDHPVAAALCSFEDNSITILEHFAENCAWERVRNTVLHEVAHAVAGFDAGHGPRWQAIALSIGCDAEAKVDVLDLGEAFILSNYKWELAVSHPCGRVERLKLYAKRRSNMAGKHVAGRRETKNLLNWVPIK